MSRIEFEKLRKNKFYSKQNYRLYLQEKKRRERIRYSITVVSICFILGIIVLLSAIALNNVKAVEYSYEEYTVQAGDTLFDIAKESNLDKQLNEIAWLIGKDNNVQAGNLQIGQTLLIRNEVKCK